MSAPLPKELRDRFAHCIAEGQSSREAARRLRISAATGARWPRKIRTHDSAPCAGMGQPDGSGKLGPHRSFLEKLIAQDPDITLFGLRDALAEAEAEGGKVHHSAIANLLCKLAFTNKKSRWWPLNAAALRSGAPGLTG